MSLTTGVGNVRHAARTLRARWSEVKRVWYDQNSQQFEEKHVGPVLARLRTLELTMGHMATILQKVRRDCG